LPEQAVGKISDKTAVLNLGGVANMTWWNGGDAFVDDLPAVRAYIAKLSESGVYDSMGAH